MATIDPSIALGVKPLQLDNPMNAMAMYSQIQGAQQANQLNQMKMAEYERARAEEEGIRNHLAGGADLSAPETRTALLKYGKTGLEYAKALTEQDKMRTELNEKRVKLATDKTALFRDALADVNTPQQAAAWIAAQHQDPDLKPIVSSLRPLDQALAAIPTDPKAFADWKAKNALGMSKFIERNTMTAYEKAQVGLRGQEVDLRRREVDRASDPEMQQKLARARAIGEAAGKGDVAALQAYPKAIAQAEQTVGLIDQMIGKRDSAGKLMKGEKTHPGFQWAVGAGISPTFTMGGTDTADFQKLFDQVSGGAFLQAFEALKGGGAITEKEGAKGTAALTRMNLAQSEKEFVKAALEFQDVVKAGAARAQERAVKATGAAPAPAAPAAPAGTIKFLGFEESK
jgi:hypothetical protein